MELTQAEIENDLGICDCCHDHLKSSEMFWNIGDYETENQEFVAERMAREDWDSICEVCFYEIVEESKEK